MASYYERSGSKYYYLRYQTADGIWKAKSSGIVIDSMGAKRKIIQMVQEYSLKEQCVHGDGGGAFFRSWVGSFLEYRYTNAKTLWRYKNAWESVGAYFDSKAVTHPGEVTYALIHEYMRWRTDEKLCAKANRRPAKWNTALVETRVLGAIMHEAVKRGYILVSPCVRLGLPRRNSSEKREIEMDEQERIIAILEKRKKGDWMLDCFMVGIKQGCRLSEVAVPMHQIDLVTGIIVLNVKGGKQHAAPLHADLVALVKRRRMAKAAILVDLPSDASRQWHRWFAKHGFVNLSFHCTRVTVVTRLARAGFSEVQTMQYVGHASDVVHAVYRKLRPPDLKHLGVVL
jgi:integrase